MKKASKFLAMFLLVALCFSLMSTAAYAADNWGEEGLQSEEDHIYNGKMRSNAGVAQWVNQTTFNAYTSLSEAVNAASAGQTLKLTGTFETDELVRLNKANLTLDLDGNKLTFGKTVTVDASGITIQNGTLYGSANVDVSSGLTLNVKTITMDETVAFGGSGSTKIQSGTVPTGTDSKYIPDGYVLNSTTCVIEQQNASKPVYVSSNVSANTGYYDDAQSAFNAVKNDASVSFQINKNINIDTAKTTVTDSSLAATNISLNLYNNAFTFSNQFKVTPNGTMSISGLNGATVNAAAGIVVPYGATLTIGSNVVVNGTITVEDGGTLKINGGTVTTVTAKGTVEITGGSTVTNLTADSTSNLKVSGGTIGKGGSVNLTAAGAANRNVTGGVWYTTDLSNLQKVTYDVSKIVKTSDGVYTIGSGAGTTSTTVAGTTISSGTYTSSDNFTYTAVVSGDVAIWPVSNATWTPGDGNLYFYYTPNTASAKGLSYTFYMDSTAWVIPGIDYTDNTIGTMSLGKDYLATLADGVHTLIFVCDGQTASCTFYVSATLKAVDTSKHVINSTKTLSFVCSQPISRVWIGGTEITDYNGSYYTLNSTRKTITLSADFLNARTAGETYTITVQTDNGDKPSTTFQILTTAEASSSPKTGDSSNLALWAAILVLAGGAVVAVLPRIKKIEG